MNKKVFLKNKPFDEGDGNQMSQWVDDGFKQISGSVYNAGVVSGLQVALSSGFVLSVAPGSAYDSSSNLIQVINQDTTTISSADTTNPRYDLVAIKYNATTVYNTDTANKYGYGTSYIYSQNIMDGYQIVVIKGIAGASPIVPQTPALHIALASVYVPANAASITAPNIADTRTFVTLKVGISASSLAAGSITDVLIGDRTADQTRVPSANTGKVGDFINWITNRIIAITGKANWFDTPRTTLENAVKRDGDSMTGTLTTTGGLVLETRTTDPVTPAVGRIWFRTDL